MIYHNPGHIGWQLRLRVLAASTVWACDPLCCCRVSDWPQPFQTKSKSPGISSLCFQTLFGASFWIWFTKRVYCCSKPYLLMYNLQCRKSWRISWWESPLAEECETNILKNILPISNHDTYSQKYLSVSNHQISKAFLFCYGLGHAVPWRVCQDWYSVISPAIF